MAYTSSVIYEPKRIHAAAIYCSDGRVGEHFDDFLTNGLKLPRYDRIALPGGPACLACREETKLDDGGIIENLQFLITAHELERVVLIAHDGCAFYGECLGIEPARAEAIQTDDLVSAATLIHRETGLENIEAYFAYVAGDAIRFESVVIQLVNNK